MWFDLKSSPCVYACDINTSEKLQHHPWRVTGLNKMCDRQIDEPKQQAGAGPDEQKPAKNCVHCLQCLPLLLGWSYQDAPGNGTLLKCTSGGFSDLQEEGFSEVTWEAA